MAKRTKKNEQKTELRTYKVLSRNEAISLGVNPPSDSIYNQHVLLAMRGSTVDDVLTWGYKRDNLVPIAEKRNADISQLQKMMKVVAADVDDDNTEEN